MVSKLHFDEIKSCMKYYTSECTYNIMVPIFSISSNNILSEKELNIAIYIEPIVVFTLNTAVYYLFECVCMCNGYDLLDDMEVGEMFDVLMDNATMKQDLIKTLFTLLKMFIICRYEWNIL